MSSAYLIYALADPRTLEWRYIGLSSSGLHRPAQHSTERALATCTNLHKVRWIRQVQSLGLQPLIDVLEYLPDIVRLKDAEREWIAEARRQGMALTNLTDGGDGVLNPTEEVRRRKSVSSMRAHARPEVRARRQKSNADPEVRARRSAAATEIQARPETRAKAAASYASDSFKSARAATEAKPETKARRSEGAKAACLRPEVLERKSAAAKAKANRPGERERMSIRAKEVNARPETKAKISAAARARYSDPAERVRLGRAVKAGIARAKAARGRS